MLKFVIAILILIFQIIIINGAPPKKVGNGILLTYEDEKAEEVSLVGSFNGWDEESNIMKRIAPYKWVTTITLEPGRYEYKYVVDGLWVPDPDNPPVGSKYGNSFIEIKSDGTLIINRISEIIKNLKKASPPRKIEEGILFTYKNKYALSVNLAGSFNNWNTESTPMIVNEYDVWAVVVPLPPGEYEYKYVVDGGTWVTDPINPAISRSGDNNSLIKIGEDGNVLDMIPTLTSFANPKIFYDGDFRFYLYSRPTNNNEWLMKEPEGDFKFDIDVHLNRYVILWTRLRWNTLERVDNNISVKIERAKLTLGDSKIEFTTFYNVWHIEFDDPFVLVGKKGEFLEPFGRGEEGASLSLPFLFFDELLLLYSNEIAYDRDLIGIRAKKKGNLVDYGFSFRDDNFEWIKYDQPDPDGGNELFNTHEHKYICCGDFALKLSDKFKIICELGQGKKELVADETDQGITGSDKVLSDKVWPLSSITRYLFGFEYYIAEDIKLLSNFEIEKHNYTKYRGNYKSVYKRIVNGILYKDKKIKLNITCINTIYDLDSNMPWEYLWDYSYFDRLQYYQYPLVGYKNNFVIEAYARIKLYQKQEIINSWGELMVNSGQIYWNERPKTIEIICKLNAIFKMIGMYLDIRSFNINDSFLGIKEQYYTFYNEIYYRLNPWIKIKLGYGLYPYNFDNDYRARREFLIKNGVTSDTLKNNFYSLGKIIKEAEEELQDYREVVLGAEIRF